MNNVSKKMLGEVVVFINGDRGVNYPKAKDYVPKGIPFFSASDLDGRKIDLSNAKFISEEAYEKLRNGKTNEGDILFCLRGSLGNIGLAKNIQKGAIASSLVIIRPTIEIEKDYLYYTLSGPINRKIVRELDNGSVQGNLSVTELKKVEISLPNLKNQKAIAHVISTIDDKIEINKKSNETLEGIAKAIFKSWFIDFDPVRAKSEGLSTGLPDEISNLFPDSFADSELGEIPKSFSVSTIGQVSDFINGFAFASKDWKSEGLGVVKIGSISPGFVDVAKVSYVSEEFLKTHKKYQLLSGDIVIGMTGAYLGQVGMIPIVEKPLLLNQRTGKFNIKEENILSKSFLFYLMNNLGFNQSVETLSYGSAQHNVSGNDICSMKFIKPTAKINKIFADIGQIIIKKTLINYAEISSLHNIRNCLLPKLISGGLRISDAEKMIEKLEI